MSASERAAILTVWAERWVEEPTEERGRALREAVEDYRIACAVDALIEVSRWAMDDGSDDVEG